MENVVINEVREILNLIENDMEKVVLKSNKAASVRVRKDLFIAIAKLKDYRRDVLAIRKDNEEKRAEIKANKQA
tara:strand:+ start:440 stop:661 length:222 start_codon:yes stop_codon:yes gene_type:complete